MGKKYLETKNKSLESSILGVWKTATSSARNRQYHITKPKGSKYYVVIDDTTNKIHIKSKHKHLINNTVHPMFITNKADNQLA